MEIRNLNNIVLQIIYLPVFLYRTNYSWNKLLTKTGYFNIESELVTIDLIKKNINSNNEILDGWIYFSENQKSENHNFIWFNNLENKYEIKKYNSKNREYSVLKKFPDKETCCAYFIKSEIETAKQMYYEKIKHEKKKFYGCVSLQKKKGIWKMKYEQKQLDSSFYPLVKLSVSFDKIELKTITNKLLFSIQKGQKIGIIILKNSIKFILNDKINSNFNMISYFNYFSFIKIVSFLKKFKWVSSNG